MTQVEAEDSASVALGHLLIGVPWVLLKQLVDVVLGFLMIAIVLATTADAFSVDLSWILSVLFTPEFVFYGISALLAWVYLLMTVVIPESWFEFAEKEDIEGEATGIELEFRRVFVEIFGALYKAMVVILAAAPATDLVQAGLAWIAPLWVVGIPPLETLLHRRGTTSPAFMLSFLFLLGTIPAIYITAFVTYAIRRSPDATRRAKDFIVAVLQVPFESQPENETLLDLVTGLHSHRSSKNR